MSDAGRPERLRVAVKAAGGNKSVAERSGIPLATLNKYLAGRDMKVSAFIALANACGVSLDWLATGWGDMFSALHRAALSIPTVQPSPDGKTLIPTPEYRRLLLPPPQSVAEPQQSLAQPPALDVPRLKQAIDLVRAIGGPGSLDAQDAPTRIATAYDILTGAQP